VTIIVGIATPDGIVLGSDSRTTRSDGERHRILSDSAQKVFAVGRFGVATSGLAFIGNDTIAGVMDRFLAHLPDGSAPSVDAFADSLGAFFDARFSEWLESMDETWDPDKHGPAVQFLVAGYDDEGVGHIHEVMIPGPERGAFSPDTIGGGTMWRGQTDVIVRLIKGIDWGEYAMSELDLPDDVKDVLGGFEYDPLEPITVQDALDYASFLVQTTIDMQRFSDGTYANPGLVPGCGGPQQLLVVDRNGAKWAQPPTRTVRHEPQPS
jgi:hypothetical protein